MKLTLATAFALFASVLAIPPENFGFPSAPNDTILSVGFAQPGGTYQTMTEGILFGWGIPNATPVLGLQTNVYQSLASYTGQYLVMMVDPDASTPENPSRRFILHWLQPNVTLSNATTNPSAVGLLPGSRQLANLTTPIAPYARPMPPSNSSAHRYILYAFQQPNNFTIPPAYSGYSASNRTSFNLTNFIRDARLGTPAAANYMYVTNQTNVPTNFVASAGGTYPGGNGGAVTSGDPGASYLATASATSTASGAGSSSSRAASSSAGASGTQASASSSAGAAMITGVSGIIGAALLGVAAIL